MPAIMSRPLVFLLMRSIIVRSFPSRGKFHLPLRPIFSFSVYRSSCFVKVGRLLEIWRMCRVKKPWFCVENDGYPLTPWLLSLADSQVTLLPFPRVPPLAGLERPLVFISRPGEDHPPPGTGEGLLLKDMARFGVPVRKASRVNG